MDRIVVENKEINQKIKIIQDEYIGDLSDKEIRLIRMVIIKYKKYSTNEYFIYFIFIYGLAFFKKLDLNSKILDEKDKKILIESYKNFSYESEGKIEKYLSSYYKMDEDMFIFKMVIKNTLILFENDFLYIIDDKEKYFRFLGYIIPYLTIKRSKLLGFFQDEYFKRAYSDKYIETQKRYENEINFSCDSFANLINELAYIMDEIDVIGKTIIRKKSYFSIYNKIKRKEGKEIFDIIGMRIIFNNVDDLYKFADKFEKNYIFVKKKDYIKNSKPNGYKSIHYNFLVPYKNIEVKGELQLRTVQMDRDIRNNIGDFEYTIKKSKWNEEFSEVMIGYEHMKKNITKIVNT